MRKRYIATRLAKVTKQLATLLERALDEIPDDDGTESLPPMEQAILDALQDGKPRPGKQIAKLTQYAYGGRLRHALSDLTRRGLLHHSVDGYRLMSRNVPAPHPARDSERAGAEESGHERKRPSS